MSLKFVVRKLEGHSLQEASDSQMEGEQDGGRTSQPPPNQQEDKTATAKLEKDVDDSGTESDEDTDHEASIDQDEGDMDGNDTEIVDSGVGLNTRSAGKVGGKSSLLPQLRRQPQEQPATAADSSLLLASGSSCGSLEAVQPMDDTDNHSSEEELEDIIGESRKVYVSETVVHHVTKSGVGSRHAVARTGGHSVGSSSTVEKRKWSEVDQGGGSGSGSSGASSSRTGSGSSGDEEVCGYMGCSTTPVQFCTSPPLNVYKPRRSQSPPPKLFHLAAAADSTGGGGEADSASDTVTFLKGNTKVLTGAFRPGGALPLPQGRGEEGEDETDGAEGGARRSPNKKHRSTPRPLARQRPCLDFEKMQQIKTKVVTSWRQGTELSLFCW